VLWRRGEIIEETETEGSVPPPVRRRAGVVGGDKMRKVKKTIQKKFLQ
jgi:hypothetical protein